MYLKPTIRKLGFIGSNGLKLNLEAKKASFFVFIPQEIVHFIEL